MEGSPIEALLDMMAKLGVTMGSKGDVITEGF